MYINCWTHYHGIWRSPIERDEWFKYIIRKVKRNFARVHHWSTMQRKGAVRLELMVFGERKDCITQRSAGTWLQPMRGQGWGGQPMREELWCEVSVRRGKWVSRWDTERGGGCCCILSAVTKLSYKLSYKLAAAASCQLTQGCDQPEVREALLGLQDEQRWVLNETWAHLMAGECWKCYNKREENWRGHPGD